MNAYEIYVSNDNGWFEDCPNYEAIFFGDTTREGVYVPNIDSDHTGGHIIVMGYAHAKKVLDQLNTTGEWVTHNPDRPDFNEETHPTYSMRRVMATTR